MTSNLQVSSSLSSGESQRSELLLRELLAGLSDPAAAAGVSVGLVGSTLHSPQPPAHCLHACLGGDASAIKTRGCPLLIAATKNECPPDQKPQRCPQGFEFAAQATVLGGAPATLVTLQGPLPTVSAGGTAPLLRRLDDMSRLVQHVGQLLEENSGFADEVLRSYEQLNLIFDLTQQISQVTDVPAIERVLMERLGGLLGVADLWIIGPTGQARSFKPLRGATQASELPVEAGALAEMVRRTRQVHVSVAGERSLLGGPLFRLDAAVDVVLAQQPPTRPAFTSGDMMIFESVLTFGGQIISNSELHERLRQLSVQVTRALVAAIDKKDRYTSGHSERGGFLTRLTAQELGVPPAEQQNMEWAGLLHDIGKIGIPEEILCKPGKLTEEEFEIIKQHPRMGYEILQPIASLGVILDGVLYHHEYPDGSGYPEGLRGEQIPLVARIIHVVDTFDALTSTRSYRKAFSIAQAMEIIAAEKGTRIDPVCADAFFRAFERYRREQPDDFAARFAALRDTTDATD